LSMIACRDWVSETIAMGNAKYMNCCAPSIQYFLLPYSLCGLHGST
jgi:hypothetical protein